MPSPLTSPTAMEVPVLSLAALPSARHPACGHIGPTQQVFLSSGRYQTRSSKPVSLEQVELLILGGQRSFLTLTLVKLLVL